MTFIEALENPETRELIDSIEDLEASLTGKPNGDSILEEMKESNIKELAEYGYNWVR